MSKTGIGNKLATFNINEDLWQQFGKIAQTYGASRAGLIKQWIQAYVELSGDMVVSFTRPQDPLSNVVDPHPMEPHPMEPSPVEPSPVDPHPVDPSPVEPSPVDPHPVDPHPVDPHPVEPSPVDPHPVDPHPVDPHPVEPSPVDPHPMEPSPDPLNILGKIPDFLKSIPPRDRRSAKSLMDRFVKFVT